jgi:hypothetical protein
VESGGYQRVVEDLRLLLEVLVGFEPDLEVLDFELRLAVFDLNVPARPVREVGRLVEALRPAEVDFFLFTEILIFFAPVAEVVRRVVVARPGVDLLRPSAPFERGVSPEATPMRAPDIAPVKARSVRGSKIRQCFCWSVFYSVVTVKWTLISFSPCAFPRRQPMPSATRTSALCSRRPARAGFTFVHHEAILLADEIGPAYPRRSGACG